MVDIVRKNKRKTAKIKEEKKKMTRIGNIGIVLKDETKEVSIGNKVLKFHFFGQCPKCRKEVELVESMKTDSCECGLFSFAGWKYKCKCGHVVQIPEDAFDSAIDSFYEAGFVKDGNNAE